MSFEETLKTKKPLRRAFIYLSFLSAMVFDLAALPAEEPK